MIASGWFTGQGVSLRGFGVRRLIGLLGGFVTFENPDREFRTGHDTRRWGTWAVIK